MDNAINDVVDKVKVEIKTPEKTTIEYNGVSIEINPFIDFSEQTILINEYIKDYFGELNEIVIPKSKRHVFEAECRQMNYIIQLNTNIDMSDIDNNIYVEPELWGLITEEIINYYQFRNNLEDVVHAIEEQEKLDNSLGRVLSGLLEKADKFIEELSNISPETIKELQETGKEMLVELEKSSVLRNPNDLSELNTPLIEEAKSKE